MGEEYETGTLNLTIITQVKFRSLPTHGLPVPNYKTGSFSRIFLRGEVLNSLIHFLFGYAQRKLLVLGNVNQTGLVKLENHFLVLG